MKKIIITTICIFAFTTLLKAQTGIPDNTTGPIFIKDSKVGIGTSPIAKLHVNNAPYSPDITSSFPSVNSKGDVTLFLESSNYAMEFGNARGQNNRRAWILARHHYTTRYGGIYSTLHLQPDIGDKSAYEGVAIGFKANTRLPTKVHLAVNGNVGIGTTNPKNKLDVNGIIHAKEVKGDLIRIRNDAFVFNNTNGPALEFLTNYGMAKIMGVDGRKNKSHAYTGSLVFKTRMHIAGNDHGYYERMRITASGNVGIGTNNPQHKLDVNGAINATNIFIPRGYISSSDLDKTRIRGLYSVGYTGSHSRALLDIGGFIGSTPRFQLMAHYADKLFFRAARDSESNWDNKGFREIIMANEQGNVGIGTTNPKHKLDVNGIIHAKEVKVDLNGWSDFVFADGYDLPDINEIAQYIEIHKHLPDVPTATEVKEKGISLGQMNAKLLQKIEELTLYTIKQEKELETQKQKNSELELRLEKLERLLETANQ